MRTKHLLTAMALPVLFAACTNEELEVVSNGAETSRAVVENVVLNFSRGVESRLAYDIKDGYTWEANDQIGASLMDEINTNYQKPDYEWSEWFDLVDYIQTNYKFTRDAKGNWETEAKLCEGNYFFSYPYNANRGLRYAYTFSCADQTLANTNTNALLDAFAENNSFVGYGKVVANSNEGESVAVPMVPVFGSTGFTLKNTGTNTYTIEKIVLNGKAVSSFATVKPASNNFDAENYVKMPAGDERAKKMSGVLEYKMNGRIDVTIEAGNAIGEQESINVIVMSGANEIKAADDAVLEIHTDKGLIRGINLNVKHEADNGKLGTNAVVNVLTDKALAGLGSDDKINVTFDDTSLDVPADMEIYSSDELARFIKWNAAVNDVELTARLRNDVTITKEMCEDLAASKIKSITVTGNSKVYGVTIAADAPANAMDLFTFTTVRDITVKGTQTITENNVIVPVFVIKGATLNVSKNIAAVVENEGTVNVKAGVTITKLNNMGTVVADKNLTTVLNNLGTVTNNATLTIESGYNHGTITNKGTMTGAMENADEKQCGTHKVKHAAGVIDNYGTVAGLVNNARVNMKSAAAKYNDSDETSAGEIENSIMSKYVNKAAGEQIIAVVDAEETKASELVAIVKGSGASELYLSGKLVLDPETDKDGKLVDINVIGQEDELTVYAKGLTITGEGKITFCRQKKTGLIADFVVVEKTATEVETDVQMVVKNLTVDGSFTIQKGAVVTVKGTTTGNVENYGTLN